jgi:tetratricopeptide (TPR) repeat protein
VEAAVQAYLEGARGAAKDTALYNAGTAAMAAGDIDGARQALTLAARSVDPMMRYRSLYNLGTLALTQARADTAGQAANIEQAVASLREALLLAPGSERAKWNLELAERLRPPPSGGGGGGGGPQPPQPEKAPPSAGGGGLSQRQAEQILSSMEREELGTQVARQRRLQSTQRTGKDW